MGKKVYKFKEIPTNNRLHVIDNFSPNYNYIVEDDKIYYSKKRVDDYWVDISDNETARKNLFGFLSQYDFRGYEDREKEIFDLLNKGKFDLSTFNKPASQTTQPEQKVTHQEVKEIPKPSGYKGSPFMSSPILSYPQLSQGIKYKNPQGDKQIVWNNFVDGKWGENFNLAKNYIVRQWDKIFNDRDPVSNLSFEQTPIQNSDYSIRPGSFVGYTIRKQVGFHPLSDQYIVPESTLAQNYIYGFRNRGDYRLINSEHAAITSFKPFKPYGKHDKAQTYIGIDKDGNLLAGDISNFQEGSYLSPTYSNDIAYFLKDESGNIKMSPSLRNKAQNQPAYAIWNNGEIIEKPEGQAINVLVRKDDPQGNQYGSITGGRVLVKVGDELRLLVGSVKDIDEQFEAMKKRNNAQYGTFYTLDNGSFNNGLRTYSQKFTENLLRAYDNKNSGGGNFLYVIKQKDPVFKTDTVWTPNIRTEKDESYKKGHDLTNEQKSVVLHHTAFTDPDLTSVVEHLTNPKSQASSHVVIGYDGSRVVLARPDQVTFHSGPSIWNNRDNVNDFAIGVEFQGNTAIQDLTEQQIDSFIEYIEPIIMKNNIRLEDIVTHQMIRDLYNQTAKSQGKRPTDNKIDIDQKNYKRIIDKLVKKVYFKK